MRLPPDADAPVWPAFTVSAEPPDADIRPIAPAIAPANIVLRTSDMHTSTKQEQAANRRESFALLLMPSVNSAASREALIWSKCYQTVSIAGVIARRFNPRGSSETGTVCEGCAFRETIGWAVASYAHARLIEVIAASQFP